MSRSRATRRLVLRRLRDADRGASREPDQELRSAVCAGVAVS